VTGVEVAKSYRHRGRKERISNHLTERREFETVGKKKKKITTITLARRKKKITERLRKKNLKPKEWGRVALLSEGVGGMGEVAKARSFLGRTDVPLGRGGGEKFHLRSRH